MSRNSGPRSYERTCVYSDTQTIERSIPDPFTSVELGANDPENPLPIAAYKHVITEAVRQNPITIIVAETGAGKSTQVPQYLLEAGYIVNMTAPRRLAARMISERISDELAQALNDPDQRRLVGLHTAEHNTITSDTRVTLLTDGVRLKQEVNDRDDVEHEVLIIDEIHEMNANIEIILALIKRSIAQRPNLRVVCMSATMDAPRLAAYLSDGVATPPIIEVPGRLHDVEKIEAPDSTVFDQTVQYANEDKNVLVFLPGVREITDMKRKLEDHFRRLGKRDVTVLPLHSKLSDQEQKAVDGHYPGPKIILATNIAQTSLTIKDVDVVVDSGLERRPEVSEENEQSLQLHAISQADSNQRAGRVGRTHHGIYVLTRLNSDTKYVPFAARDEYSVPEILRTDLDPKTLDVATKGIDLCELGFFNVVAHQNLLNSRRRLELLGAVDSEGKVTSRGKKMNQFPVHPTLSRMLVESDNYSEEIRAYVAAVVASIEVGKLPSYLFTANKKWQALTNETESDHLAQLDVFLAVQQMDTNQELSSLGLDVRNIRNARTLYSKIIRREGDKPLPLLQPPTKQQRMEILECVVAGMVDHVYEISAQGRYVRVLGNQAISRVISDRSLVHGGRVLVGRPYQYGTPSGERLVIEDVTSGGVQRMLGKVAAEQCVWKMHGPVQWRDGQPFEKVQQMFRGVLPTGERQERRAEPSPELRSAIIQYVLDNPGKAQVKLRNIKKELEQLGDSVPQITQAEFMAYIEQATPDDITNPSLVDAHLRAIMIQENITLDAFAPPEDRARIYEMASYSQAS